MIEIRPSTREDFDHFLKDKKWFSSMLCYSIYYKGKLSALFGRTLDEKYSVVISEIDEDVKAPKMLIFKTSLKAIRMLAKKEFPLYAICDSSKKNSGKFIESLGFYKTSSDNVYKYEVLI